MRTPSHASGTRLMGIAVLAAALAACSGTGSTTTSPSASTSGTTVDVTLTEFEVQLSSTDIPAGEVTFAVTNDGTMVHEFVVFKTDLAEDALPEASAEAAVDEEATELEAEGEVEDVEVGGTKSFTATLEPGDYVGICNIVGHYGSGMRIHFTVS